MSECGERRLNHAGGGGTLLHLTLSSNSGLALHRPPVRRAFPALVARLCRHDTPGSPASPPWHAGLAESPQVPKHSKKSVRCRGACLYRDRKSTRLNSSHSSISYAVFCLKKK